MSEDRMLADLLGEAPPARDPGFRFDVFARVTERARRRTALNRAAVRFGVLTLVGLAVPVAGAFGVTMADVEPFLMIAAALGVAYLAAALSIAGPRGVLARWRVR